MKITKQTSSLMVIKDRNIMSFLFAGIFALIGFLIIFFPDLLNADSSPILGVPFFLIGLLLIFSTTMYSITINKGINKLSIVWRKLIGYRKDEYDLNQINQLELYISHDSEQLLFILKDGEEIALPFKGVTRVMGMKVSNIRKIGKSIAEFLNIKFVRTRPKSLVESLSIVQETIREKRSRKDGGENTYKD